MAEICSYFATENLSLCVTRVLLCVFRQIVFVSINASIVDLSDILQPEIM